MISSKYVLLINIILWLTVLSMSSAIYADHPDDQYWNVFPTPPSTSTTIYGGVTAMTEYDGSLLAAVERCYGPYCLGRYYEIYNWDSTGWSEPIFTCDSFINDMIVYNGDLIIGGDFTTVDGDSLNHIARWDGNEWHSVGDGLDSNIIDLTIYNGDLIASGSFSVAGSADAKGIARWDGSTWHSLDLGVNGVINDMTDFGGELVVGGLFDTAGGEPVSNIASWNGSSWSALDVGVDSSINALEVFNNELYIGGSFLFAGGLPAFNISKWDGSSWYQMGTGTDGPINDFLVFNNQLIVAGEFYTVDGEIIERIAAWDGSTFSPMDPFMFGNSPNILIEFENKLVCGIYDLGMSGPSGLVIYWTGTEWRILMTNFYGSFYTITEYNNEMVVGGSFHMGFFYSPEIYKIARWDGLEWNQMGYLNDDVRVLKIYNSELFAGGEFFMASDSAGGIARFNGTDWELFEGGVSRNYYSTYIEVNAIIEYNGDMVIGGNFQKAGDVEADNIALWDGLNWNPLGDGVVGQVLSLAVYNGDLYVGGTFNEAGGIAVPGLARWDGLDWHKLEGGFISSLDHDIHDLIVHNNELYIGGWFKYTILSKATLCNGLARWDGTELNPVDPPLIPHDEPWAQVYDLEIYNNELYAVGSFNFSGDRIARYNGIYWRTLGSGFSGSSNIYCMGVVNDELIVGGYQKIASWSKPVSCCVLRGDVAEPKDSIVLVNDLVHLVDYLFKGGAAPSCLEEGDCADPIDGSILVNDLVWLVDYLFKGGSTPPLC